MGFLILDENTPPLTAEQIEEIKEAATHPILYDDDCPRLSPEELKQFKRVSDVVV